LNFLLLMLAMHGNVQHRLAEEINEVFGEYKDLIIDYEKLSELKYVEMVIKETLRLFSPATGKLSFSFTFSLLNAAFAIFLKAYSGR
jgi:cytochrome P450